MVRERLLWPTVILSLLLAGWLIGRRFGIWGGGEMSQFRQWLWEHRSLDLAVQAGIILVGALGASALLPRDREDSQ